MEGGGPVGLVRRWRMELVIVGTALLGALVLVVGAAIVVSHRSPEVLVGAVDDRLGSTAASSAPVLSGIGAPLATAGDGPGVGPKQTEPTGHELLRPDGRPYGSPVPFDSSITVPGDLLWVLVIGTDARPNEDMRRTRADSIHLIGANPRTGQATIIGVPRDSWIDIPGHGTQKVNQATAIGGPQLLADTLHRYLGLPIQWWVVAGFAAFQHVVDAVGGVDVEVTERMDDHGSGARFAPGFHHMDGAQALAFSRDRHDYADGDFSRSANQGRIALAALKKLRTEVADETGLRRWIGFAFLHLDLGDLSVDQALPLLAVARRTDPARTTNLVLAGRSAHARGQSVVLVDAAAAARLADDVRPDAAIGDAATDHEGSTSVPPATTTTTTGPTTTAPTPSSSSSTTAATTSSSPSVSAAQARPPTSTTAEVRPQADMTSSGHGDRRVRAGSGGLVGG